MSDDTSLAAVLARLESLEQRNAELEATVAALTAAPPPAAPATVTPIDPPSSAPVAIDRRRMLRTGLAAAGAAAATAVVAGASPAAADNGDPIKAGLENFASSSTQLTASTSSGTDSWFVVKDTPAGSSPGGALIEAYSVGGFRKTGVKVSGGLYDRGVHVDVSGTSTFRGVDSKTTGGTAIHGEAGSGWGAQLYATTGTGAYVQSDTGPGLVVLSDGHQLYLGPTAGLRQAPTLDTTFHNVGEFVHDGLGDLWFCTAGGTPGTWRKLSGSKTAGAFHLLPAPARVYDSRAGTAPTTVGPKTPFGANTTRTFDLKVNSSTVPAGATGALVTLLLVNASTTPGNLTIWANGVAKPLANTMVWGGTGGRFTASAVTALDTLARVQVNASQATDLVIDVVGYYR